MALTAKQKERLDKLDFGTGGGFSDFMTDRKKLEPAGSKFLFVGLGGKGSKTVASIKTEVYKKIKCPESKKQPENFEYLAIDTAKDDLEHLCQGGFGQVGLSADPADSETCQLFDDSAAERLEPEKRYLIPEYVTSWLNPTINAELQGDGAGGIRQAGRYLLFGEDAFSRLKNILTQKLEKLNKQIKNTAKENLIVYVFAGVSGGTGSGTVIDIPYIIRQICKVRNWKVKIYGYIFLPDTYPTDAEGDHLKYNAYAALKEIDTLMNIGNMDGAAHFKATYTPSFSVDSVERIFNSCVLVSGKKKEGGLVTDPDRFTRKVVVDNIVNLVVDNITSNGFMANSFLDNSISEIQNAVVPLSNVPKNAYYRYTVIGTGSILLPMEQILTYIARGTFEMLQEGWNKKAQQKDVEGLLGKIHMLPQDQANAVIGKSKVPLMEYTKGIGGLAKKQQIMDNSLYNTIQANWMAQNVSLYAAWDVAKNENLEFIVRNLDDYYRSKFKDEDAGIYFLRELLSFRVVEGAEFNGILHRLNNEYLASIQGFIGGQEEIQRQADARMREIRAELDSPLCVSVIANNKIEEYRSLCVQKLVADNMIYLYDTIVRDCMKQIIKWVETRLEELETYIDIFTYMKELVERNYELVMEDAMPGAEDAGTLLEFSKRGNDDATDQVLAYLDSMLQAKTPEGLVTVLEDSIQKTEQNWVNSSEDFNPMKVFVNFLEQQYNDLSNLTLQKFLEIKYGVNGINLGMQDICQELKNNAEFTFCTSPALNLNVLAAHKYVVIPAAASQEIKSALSAFAKQNKAIQVDSPDTNSIYWYNLAIGVPLFALKDIEVYEQKYESNSLSGMHIQETAENNWKEFPSLSNQALWSTPNFNLREKEFANQVQEDVKKYLKSGLIVKNDIGLYEAFCMSENDNRYTREKVLEWCRNQYLSAPTTNEEGLIESGKAFFECMKGENAFVTYQVTISSVFMNPTDDNVYQLIRMHIFLYRKLQETYAVYEECCRMISESNQTRQKEIRWKKNLKRFYDYWRTGIVQMSEDNILLEKKNHQQEEILYFSDYSKWDNQFFVYQAFRNLMSKFSEDELAELDEYRDELTDDHSKVAQEKYRKLSDELMEECHTASDLLKKLDVKKTFEKNEQQSMIAVLAGFYADLLFLEV